MELAAAIGITEANLSLMKNGKIKGIKLDTVDRLCKALKCQPGDLFCYEEIPGKRHHNFLWLNKNMEDFK